MPTRTCRARFRRTTPSLRMSESYDDSNRTPQYSTGYIHMRLTVCSLSPRSCAQVREGCPLEQLPPTHTHPHTLPITDSTTHCLLTTAGIHRRECALHLNKPKHAHAHARTHTRLRFLTLCADLDTKGIHEVRPRLLDSLCHALSRTHAHTSTDTHALRRRSPRAASAWSPPVRHSLTTPPAAAQLKHRTNCSSTHARLPRLHRSPSGFRY